MQKLNKLITVGVQRNKTPVCLNPHVAVREPFLLQQFPKLLVKMLWMFLFHAKCSGHYILFACVSKRYKTLCYHVNDVVNVQ